MTDHISCEDAPPTLWTDDPIIGTEFMTHSQGQGGFEVHFRTDSRKKYEAVQEECRRQIGHEKPAADVWPVKRGEWDKHEDFDEYGGGRYVEWSCSECCHIVKRGWAVRDKNSDKKPTENCCPNCGARMEES